MLNDDVCSEVAMLNDNGSRADEQRIYSLRDSVAPVQYTPTDFEGDMISSARRRL